MVAIRGNQVEIRPSIGGPTEMKHVKHVKYILPVNKYIKHKYLIIMPLAEEQQSD